MKQKGDNTDAMINKKGDKKGDKRKQKGDKTDTMTHKKGDKTGDKGRQEGRQRETSRTEGGHDVPQQPTRTSETLHGKQMNRNAGQRKRTDTSNAGTEPGRQMNRNVVWPAEKGGRQQ